MLSEEKVMKLLKRRIKVYARTDSDVSLGAVIALEEVLELSSKETDEMLKEELDKLNK